MVVTRSGKNTNVYESRTQRCGHQCSTIAKFKCCVCEDTRPFQAHYVAEKRPNMFESAYVSRTYYYCPTCKTTARSHRQPLAERPPPEPVKIDFSKMKRKPASDPALFRPSPKLTPEDRVEILKNLNRELRKMYESSENTSVGLRTDIKFLQAEVDELKNANKEYIDTICGMCKHFTTVKPY